MATVTKPIILDETGQEIVAALQIIATHAAGLVGQGVPAGGTTGQVLKKASGADYDTEWADESGGSSVSPYTSNPAPLGTASPGSSDDYARGDHVHPKPTAADIGAGTYSKPSGGIPASDLAPAVQTSLGKADSALQSVPSTYRTAAAQDVIDAGKADKVTEVTVSTAGAVSQTLDAGKIYHFTGALTALTVTATDPTTGKYQFDFISGSTAPTLTVPASWVMPDNFLVEPSARYSLSIQNGYCSLEKWSDSHSPFIYLDSTAGDFVMNNSGISSDGKVYANVGSEVVAVSIGGKLKSQLANNTWLKICDISANAKALIGSTYIESYISVGSGKVAQCAFNTWESASELKFKNNTGAALAANSVLSGTLIIMRTL